MVFLFPVEILENIDPKKISALYSYIIPNKSLIVHHNFQVGFFYTDAVVLKKNMNNAVFFLKNNIDPRCGGHIVFDGIGQKIHQQHFK